MATLRKLSSGKWNVQVRKKGYPAQTKTFRTKAAAERWGRDIEDKMDKGSFLDLTTAQETTVKTLLERYQEDITPRKRSKVKEESRIGILIRDLGDITLAQLTAERVVEWTDKRLSRVSSDTVRKELNTLSHAFDVAMVLWRIHLPINPVMTARKTLTASRTLKMGVIRERRLYPGEFRKLLSVSRAEHRALWVWFIESAMRRGEVANIKKEHKHGDFLKIPDTKSGRPRTIPITRHMARAWKRLPFGLTPDAITRAFDRACRRAGIVGLRLHDLRHEAASRLFEKGLDIQEVATITGHSDWKSLKRYTHPTHEAIARKLSAGRPGKTPRLAHPTFGDSRSSQTESETAPPKLRSGST